MTNAFWASLANTPWWVYVVFIYLLQLGVSATKPHLVPVKKLFIFPIFFLALSIISVYLNLKLSWSHFLIWFATLLFGTLAGYWHFRWLKIQAVKNAAQLYLPGTWSLFIFISILFALKFYYADTINTFDLRLIMQPKFAPWWFMIYGIFTGLFIGRIIYSLRCLKTGPYWSAN